MSTPAIGVEDLSESSAPGSFEWIVYGDDKHIAGMHFKCPSCGNSGCIMFSGVSPDGGAKWDWNGSVDKPSAKPSILHNRGVCGWHGYLTDGAFYEVA